MADPLSGPKEAVGTAAAEADFLTFVDLAATHTLTQLPGLDREAMLTILLLHRVTDVVIYDLESSVHRPAGWSFPGFRVMFVLWVVGETPLTRLAELTGNSRASISALVKTLERELLVSRRADTADQRRVQVQLTKPGERRLRAALAEHNVREADWTAQLTPKEQRQLVALLRKVVNGVSRPQVRSRG